MKRITFVLSFVLGVLAVAGCASNAADSIASYSKEIRIDDPVTVRLYDAFTMKESDAAIEAAKKAITVSPKVDFDVQVVDPQTLCIVPKQPLEYNTTYKVTADFGKIAGVSGGKQTFEIKTLAPVLLFDYSKLTGYPDIDDRYQVTLEVSSPESLDGKYLESGFSVKGTDASVTWVHAEDGKTHTVSVGNIAAKEHRGSIELVHNWPKYAAESSRRYEIPAKGQFVVVESEVKIEPYAYEIAFSSSLDPKQDFQGLVAMPGAGKLSFIVKENILRIVPATKAEEKQFLSISKAVKSTKGQKLETDFERWFEIPSGEPMVRFITRGSVLPSSGDVNLPFQAINYGKARVRVKRIYGNNVLQSLPS